MAPQPPVKRATWADQAAGFELPSRQHTARVQESGNVAPVGPFPRGTERGDGDNRYTLLANDNNFRAPQPPAHLSRQFRSRSNDISRADNPSGRQREMFGGGRGRTPGRGGRNGRGRGRGYDWRNSSSPHGTRPLPPPRNVEYTTTFIRVLVPLLQIQADIPVTLEGKEFEELSSNEYTLLLFHIAAERGHRYWPGDKYALADRWTFTHPDEILAAINDPTEMRRVVSRFSAETDLFPQFDDRTAPLQYTSLMGDLLEKLGTARQRDNTLTTKPSRKIMFDVMMVYITRLLGDGPDERKLFEMLRSLPPLQLVPLLTSPGAFHYYLYQRGMEKWQDPTRFTWNPLRIQRNIDYVTYTVENHLSTSPATSPLSSVGEQTHNTVEDTRQKGGASTIEFPSDTEFDEEADMIASRIEIEWTLSEPNKLLQLDLLTIAQMTDDDAWKGVVYPALEQYLMKYYPEHQTHILTRVKRWSLPELMCYLREPGALTETIRGMGLERLRAIAQGTKDSHRMKMYGRDSHTSNSIGLFDVSLTGKLEGRGIAQVVRDWVGFALPLVHGMGHVMSIETTTPGLSAAAIFDVSALPTENEDLESRYSRLCGDLKSTKRTRIFLRVRTSLDLGKLRQVNSTSGPESRLYCDWARKTLRMSMEVIAVPSTNFVPGIMILYSSYNDVEDDVRGEISQQILENFSYDLIPTDWHICLRTKRISRPTMETPKVPQVQILCIDFDSVKADELRTLFLQLNVCERTRLSARATYDFVYCPAQTSATFSDTEYDESLGKQFDYLAGRLVATVKGVPASFDLCHMVPPRHKDGQTVWDMGSLLISDEKTLFYSRKSGDHVAALFDKITPFYNSGGRRIGKYAFIGRKQRYTTMKEYLIEHLHRGLVEDFPDQDWSKLVITLGGSSQVIGPAETIFTLPTSTPPRRPHSGLTAASSAHLPGAVTPATSVAAPRVSANAGQAEASPPLISTSHVIESPLPLRQQSTLTEDRIREIFRQEIRSAWDPETIAKDAATNALCTLLHRMDYRDRQWQHDFMPKAVEIISRSVISSLDTATRSQYELPTDVDEEHEDPALRARGVVDAFWKTLDPDAAGTEDDSRASQDDIYETPHENKTAEEEECMTRGATVEGTPPRDCTPSNPQ